MHKDNENTRSNNNTTDKYSPKNILLIPAKYSRKIIIPKDIIMKLPERIMLFSSVQFLEQLPIIQRQLESKGKTILMDKSRNFLYEGHISEKGQLLGCNMEDFNSRDIDFDAFMYIGDGLFHPKALLVNNNKDIYCYDPKIDKLSIIDKSGHEAYAKRVKGAKLRFLSSKNIGMIMTTKKGQGSTKRALLLKSKLLEKWPEKSVFMFFANELNFNELENFNFIDCYINCACARIGHDDSIRTPKPIINIADVESLLKQ